ncbi:MAG: slipin family protein [Chloroflexi bacterium]|nr:MAG: slipin family protein [Chloroflexota bacterium]
MSPTTVGLLIVAILAVITILSSLRICNEWERKVVLRLGRFGGVRGPGVFFLLPYVEQTPFTIDTRVTTTAFMAEQTLTKDGASVTVDAIMYWRIVDAGRAAIQVVNFTQAVMGAAQGGLRDIIGRNDLSTVLSQRRELDEQLTVTLDEQTEPWGIKVQSVQLRDIKVPDNLQDALSRMAQAEREKQARVILGESEILVAKQFAEAGELYRAHPTALHLRGMNMLYETMRSGLSTVIVVPSSALESMNLGAIGGISALGSMPDARAPDVKTEPTESPR